jgi:hypothetical protein
MAIQKEEVSIDVQDIIELLHSGYTWYKKDDLGYGSIQEKYNALDMHIKIIQKHPELQNVDTVARVFIITNKKNKQDNERNTTVSANNGKNEEPVAIVPVTSTNGSQYESRVSNINNNHVTEGVTETESADAFFNL